MVPSLPGLVPHMALIAHWAWRTAIPATRAAEITEQIRCTQKKAVCFDPWFLNMHQVYHDRTDEQFLNGKTIFYMTPYFQHRGTEG